MAKKAKTAARSARRIEAEQHVRQRAIAPEEADEERLAMEGRHLVRIVVLALLGFLLASLAMAIKLQFNFQWALLLAAVTCTFGNLAAYGQTNMKRLLAYSSIANVGYLLMAFVPYGNGNVLSDAVSSALFFLVGYGLDLNGRYRNLRSIVDRVRPAVDRRPGARCCSCAATSPNSDAITSNRR